MKINLIETKELLDLEKEIGYELEVNERRKSAASSVGTKRFYVSFKKGEVMERNCLVSKTGDGDTIDEALKDYAKQITCQTIVFDAFTDNRKELVMPKVIHTKLLNK